MNHFINFVFGHIGNLRHTFRYNTTPQAIKENVAEHSYYVTLYARILCDYAKENGVKVDTLSVVDKAMVHDTEETISGDIINPIKSGKLKEALEEINQLSIRQVWEGEGNEEWEIGERFIKYWKSYKKDGNIEDLLVEIADVLSVVQFAFEQVRIGNTYYKYILLKNLGRLEGLTSKHDWLSRVYVDAYLYLTRQGIKIK